MRRVRRNDKRVAQLDRAVYEHKIIRDSVHGNIKIEGLLLDLMETPEVQRLNCIHQLGFAYLVYPGAHHSRIEHSLGTAHIAGKIAEQLNLENYEKTLVQAVGLLHDIGHGPYSHTLEYILGKKLKKDHVDITKQIITGEYSVIKGNELIAIDNTKTVAEILERYDLEPRKVANLVSKSFVDYSLDVFLTKEIERRYLHQIIHSPIDADQIDFLIRDAYYTGVAYGIIDTERLIQTMTLFKDELVMDKKGVSAIESMLVARGLMYSSVYFHKTVRIAEIMLARAVERALELGKLEELNRMVDSELLAELEKAHSYCKEIVLRLKYRKLFKKAYSKDIKEFSKEELDALSELDNADKRLKKERELCRKVGAKEGYVLIDTPGKEIILSEPRLDKIDIRILDNGKLRFFSDYSPIAKAMRTRKIVDWAVMVSTQPKYSKQVAKVAERVLLG
ncbi:MAG: HD domain-containing protein [Candidatus Thermoplasmatota archaeon]|nr:HD domain-containing protein [Candidatus Thermoplasmatota archaeon]